MVVGAMGLFLNEHGQIPIPAPISQLAPPTMVPYVYGTMVVGAIASGEPLCGVCVESARSALARSALSWTSARSALRVAPLIWWVVGWAPSIGS